MTLARSLALGESLVLRHWARQGRVPTHVPIDYWSEWDRTKHGNARSFKAAA